MRLALLAALLWLGAGEARAETPAHASRSLQLSQLTVKSVTLGKPRSAVLVYPDGKEYVVHEGTVVGSGFGRVVAIGKDGVTVRETVADETGNIFSIHTTYRVDGTTSAVRVDSRQTR